MILRSPSSRSTTTALSPKLCNSATSSPYHGCTSIYVYGHTDDIGSDEYNLDLSQRRARTVRDYLVEAGLDSSIITTRGYGKSSPRVPATTQEARAKNRRVEIGIVDVSLDFGREARQSK